MYQALPRAPADWTNIFPLNDEIAVFSGKATSLPVIPAAQSATDGLAHCRSVRVRVKMLAKARQESVASKPSQTWYSAGRAGEGKVAEGRVRLHS